MSFSNISSYSSSLFLCYAYPSYLNKISLALKNLFKEKRAEIFMIVYYIIERLLHNQVCQQACQRTVRWLLLSWSMGADGMGEIFVSMALVLHKRLDGVILEGRRSRTYW